MGPQIRFMETYRGLLQFRTFYRLSSPFEGNVTAWMAVNENRKDAIIGWYRVLDLVNATDSTAGQAVGGADPVCDFDSWLIVLTAAAPPK